MLFIINLSTYIKNQLLNRDNLLLGNHPPSNANARKLKMDVQS